MTPAELAALAVWLSLPWAMKMVFGELVDSVPIFGSTRRVYVFLGAGLIALGLLMLAAPLPISDLREGGRHLHRGLSRHRRRRRAAGRRRRRMSTEVVERMNPDGTPRAKRGNPARAWLVQVLRTAGHLDRHLRCGRTGRLARSDRLLHHVFLIGLVVPLISVSRALLVKLGSSEQRPLDRSILLGGLGFGFVVTLIGISGLPRRRSLSSDIPCGRRSHAAPDHQRNSCGERRQIAIAALLIFIFRANAGRRRGLHLVLDRCSGFTEGFFGLLQQTSAASALWRSGCSATS